MAAGIVIANIAVAQGDALKVAHPAGALPLLVVFFVAVGTSLRLDTLAAVGFAAIGARGDARRADLVGRRVAAAACAKVKDRAGEYLWTGLISQAGITLGLAAAVATEFPTWGAQVQMLLVALIAIDELVGPALFRTGLVRAGEIDAQRAAAAARRLEPRAVPPQLRRPGTHSLRHARPAAWRWRSTR